MNDMKGLVSEIGPRTHTVTKQVCDGCPSLETKYWVEYPDGERDSGTAAYCKTANRCIKAYWHENDTAPAWCPAIPPSNELNRDQTQ